jgi:DNA-binding PadR family transcriptional regulator
MANDLTTTSYAILGLLSLRSWTSYELAEQMRRALGLFWPRAESGIYREPKKLEAHGLARSTTEYVGERARTTRSRRRGDARLPNGFRRAAPARSSNSSSW